MADPIYVNDEPRQRSPRFDLELGTKRTDLTSLKTDPISYTLPTEDIKMAHPDGVDGLAFLSPIKHFPTPYASNAARRAAALASQRAASPTRQTSGDPLLPLLSSSPTSSSYDQSWDRRGPSPLPSPNIFPPSAQANYFRQKQEIDSSTVAVNGSPSPTLSAGSKTDLFFAPIPASSLPLPSKALPKTGLLGRGHPAGGVKGHDRVTSLPMPRLQEVKEQGWTPGDGPTAFTLTTPTPTSPSIARSSRIPHRSTSSPTPVSDRINGSQIPSSPLSTLPTLPEVSSVLSRPSLHLERERHPDNAGGPSPRCGDLLTPSHEEQSRGGTTSWLLDAELGQGAFSSVWSASPLPPLPSSSSASSHQAEAKVAAVKLLSKALCSSNGRTKIAFIREVEVLRHISHPSIVAFLASFSTSTHHCLVLERVKGGELFELMSDEENGRRMRLPGPEDEVGDGFVRRVFGELVRAVGWLHQIGVVHRDIKLESELDVFALSLQTGSLSAPSLIQPTVFVYQRRVDDTFQHRLLPLFHCYLPKIGGSFPVFRFIRLLRSEGISFVPASIQKTSLTP